MQKIFQLLIWISVFSLTGCQGFYQPELQQGNVFSQTQLSQLQTGMSKGEVRYILGSTILQNTFDQNRWDYVYTLQQRNKLVRSQRLTLHFVQDRLTKIDYQR